MTKEDAVGAPNPMSNRETSTFLVVLTIRRKAQPFRRPSTARLRTNKMQFENVTIADNSASLVCIIVVLLFLP